jgi:hypothetical protein
MILFVFPVFCLTWQRGRDGAAGSLWFVLGAYCSHTQALKWALAWLWGCLSLGALRCAEVRCGKYFLSLAQPDVAGISPIPVLLVSLRFRSKGKSTRLLSP